MLFNRFGSVLKASSFTLRQQTVSTASNSCDPGVSRNMAVIIFRHLH